MRTIIVRPIRCDSIRKAAVAFAFFLTFLPTHDADAAFKIWTIRSGGESTTVEAELEQFDFDSKEIVCRDRNGKEHRLPTAGLDTDGRIQLLLSREFVKSFPNDRISGEQVRFILIAVAVPSVFLLAGFFLSAMILLKNVNPVSAVTAWFGAVILGAFLVSCYVFLSARSPPNAVTGITLFGATMVTILLSLYVSIVYRTTMVKALKILALHLVTGLFLLLLAVIAVNVVLDAEQTERILDGTIFQRVGLT